MIAYSQCWEDASIVIKALKVGEGDIVMSVTSGGCNTLAIEQAKPTLIYSIDSNNAQNHLLELKMAAIRKLNQEDLLAFLGYRKCSQRFAIFQSLIPFLSNDGLRFWQMNVESIKKGIVHCGKFEQYLSVFRKYVLALIHTEQTKRALVQGKSKEEKELFYKEKWNTIGWKCLFKVFFSKAVMSGRGRTKQMFTHEQSKSIATIYYNRVKKAFSDGIVNSNFYLNYILFESQEELPLYLENQNALKASNLDRIKISAKDAFSFLKTMPNNSISKFNLSDIFEPITQSEMNLIVEEILRVAKPEARLIFWNNLVVRDIDKNKFGNFSRDIELEKKLSQQDKVFFYERFYIYKIDK